MHMLRSCFAASHYMRRCSVHTLYSAVSALEPSSVFVCLQLSHCSGHTCKGSLQTFAAPGNPYTLSCHADSKDVEFSHGYSSFSDSRRQQHSHSVSGGRINDAGQQYCSCICGDTHHKNGSRKVRKITHNCMTRMRYSSSRSSSWATQIMRNCSGSSKDGCGGSSSSNKNISVLEPGAAGAAAGAAAAPPTLQGFVRPAQLTARIKDSSSHLQLLQLLQQHRSSIKAIHVAEVLSQLADWQKQQQHDATALQLLLPELEQLLLQPPHQLLRKCGSKDTQDMIRALSVLDHNCAAVITAVVQRFMQQLSAVHSSSQITKVLHAAARSRNIGQHFTQAQLQQLLHAFTNPDLLQHATPAYVCKVLGAVETLDIAVSHQQLQQLLSVVVSRRAEIAPWILAHTLAAAAKIRKQQQQQQQQQLVWRQQQQQRAMERQFLHEFVVKHSTATPEHIALVMSAAAAAAGWQPTKSQLWQLVTAMCSKASAAKPADLSITLAAVARSGKNISHSLLRQLLTALVTKVTSNKQRWEPYTVSRALWALTKLKHVIPATDLQALTAAVAHAAPTATCRAVVELLWVCGETNFYPEELFTALHRHQYWEKHLCDMNMQMLAVVAFACGHLGHRDEALMGSLIKQSLHLLQRQQQQQQKAEGSTTCKGSAVSGSSSSSTVRLGSSSSNSSRVSEQGITNICWAVAVLDLQHLADSVITLLRALQTVLGADGWAELPVVSCRQLYQIHMWLLDCQLTASTGSTCHAASSTGSTGSSTGSTATREGLAGILTAQQLQQCKAAAQHHTAVQTSPLQQEVFAAVQLLPLNWQHPPQMEQSSHADGALLIDITAVMTDGTKLAIEVDGPSHFRRPDLQPTGGTLFKRRALAARGYCVVSVPHFAWTDWKAAGQVQEQLLRLIQDCHCSI